MWESSAIFEARWQQKEIVLGQRGSSQDPRFPQEDFVLVTVPFFVIQQSDLALEGLPKFVLSLLRYKIDNQGSEHAPVRLHGGVDSLVGIP